MQIKDVTILKKPLVLATKAQVDALEAKLWITFPEGYREYICSLGEGVLGGRFVRIYPPWRIEKELDDWRKRIGKYWFWEKSRNVLPKERALECIIIGDTVDGDELVFHPTRPNTLFVLPRHRDKTLVAGTQLLDAVEWLCSSGKLTKAFHEREFEPFDSRKNANEKNAKVTDPEGESLDDLIKLAKAWAKRHKPLKKAQEDFELCQQEYLEEKLSPYRPVPQLTAISQALVLEAKFPNDPGYFMLFKVEDKTSGLELGSFRWTMEDGSSGMSIELNDANIKELKKKK